MFSMRRTVDTVILIILLFVGYSYRHEIQRGSLIVAEKSGILAPCSRPITYSIGSFDDRFGISREAFIKNLSEAETIWETAADRNLFEYKDGGKLIVNLIYDYRQASTQQLSTLENTIDSAQMRYTSLKAEYTRLKAKVAAEKAELEAMVRSFESQKKRNAEQAAVIRAKQEAVNRDIDALNSTAATLNALAKELNLTVDAYNDISTSAGEAFDEGEFASDKTGERINIFQYSNGIKLDRVLAHEFGHALNMGHVENNQSIMYYLNSGTSFELTEQDMGELIRICKL
jgi:hypothetical protein